MVQIVEAASAATRLDAAVRFLTSLSADQPLLIVGASRAAADDLARTVAVRRPATVGLQRLSLMQLAARLAMPVLADEGVAPSTRLGAEAVATRAAFEAVQDSALQYFAPVATTPGFPRALAQTLQEVRLAGVDAAALRRLPLGGRDLGGLLERFGSCFEGAAAADRARLFRTAARVARQSPPATHLVLLDLALRDPVECELVDALLAGASAALVTLAAGDEQARRHFFNLGGTSVTASRGEADEAHPTGVAVGNSDLEQLRRYLFADDQQPPVRELDGSLELFSAPGEGRECVEIARRVLKEARRGVPLDEIAVLVRSPRSYFGLLEHALGRAGVRGWFDRGTRRPHPAGRAFLTLLACAAESLSAARFAEYLSLGQVPQPAADAGPTSPVPQAKSIEPTWAASSDEAFGAASDLAVDENADEGAAGSGTVPAPWRWEKLLVEAAVIGQGPSRWARRLEGKRQELRRQLAEVKRQEGGDAARVYALEQAVDQLEALRAFALPIVEELASWPAAATWGEWLDRFTRLAPRVLKTPAHVLRVLADLAPMAAVGPVDLDEARRVLSERLLTLQSEPPRRRYGAVFVGTPDQVRGRRFRVVFVPGLAERMFPQKPREDPLLLDDLRAQADQTLPTQPQRLAAERLLLQLAAGAASERLFVSYPRIELSEARARVPSFYALDVIRAATGVLPDHETLEERARDAGNATLAWPAPRRADDAIDEQEHDLAVLRGLLDEPDRDRVKGHAHYMLRQNDFLRRSVVERWARGEPRWSRHDGLNGITPQTRAALAGQRLNARAYSLSALQKFAACPYQFVLSAIYRLHPMEQPEALQRMDPLTRGSIFHDVQARFLRRLQQSGALPVTAATVEHARHVLDEVFTVVIAREHDELAPAVERVWEADAASIRRDLHAWLHYLARDGDEWLPLHFEFAFGEVPGERDPASLPAAVTIDEGFILRGAVDLIEQHRQTGLLRVTDHKTGRRPERIERVVIGGGAVLQPVLYAVAVQAALDRPVFEGRLFYCTSAGSFHAHPIPLTERTRGAAVEVLRVIDEAVASGFLAAAPAADACGRCDFVTVCGPDVGRRVARKPQDRLANLTEIRVRP